MAMKVLCPRCLGLGTVSKLFFFSRTCPTCRGGVWIEDGAEPHNQKSSRLKTWLTFNVKK